MLIFLKISQVHVNTLHDKSVGNSVTLVIISVATLTYPNFEAQ